MATPPGYADISCRLNLASYNRSAFITFGVDASLTDPVLTATAVRDAFLATGSLNSRLDSNVVMAEVICRLGTDGGEDLVGSVVNTTVGGRAGASPTPNVSVLIYKRTARGGRRGRGRLYIPWWINVGDIGEDGVLTPASLTSSQTAVDVFRNALVSNGVPMVLLHAPGLSVPGPPNAVTSTIVSNVVATQRRRLSRT